MIENRGATGVITYDFMLTKYKAFNIPVTHLEGKMYLIHIASIYDADTILCGPDAGSAS
jgi:phosphoribosylpyrophosphate synthetase